MEDDELLENFGDVNYIKYRLLTFVSSQLTGSDDWAFYTNPRSTLRDLRRKVPENKTAKDIYDDYDNIMEGIEDKNLDNMINAYDDPRLAKSILSVLKEYTRRRIKNG